MENIELPIHIKPFWVNILISKKKKKKKAPKAILTCIYVFITREKVETCITNNPNTIFLAPTNATVDIINNHVLDVLLESHIPLTVVTNGLQSQMPVYRNMTVIITENRYVTSFDVYITHFFKVFELFTCHRETTCNTISTLRDGYYLHIIDPNFSY